MSKIQESAGLKGHALESFIADLTKRREIYSYSSLLKHENIGSISPDYSKLLELFSFGTFKDYSENKSSYAKCALNESQINHLKTLSILSLFRGMNEVRIQKAMSASEISKPIQLFQVLVQMGIDGLVKVKIDQEKWIVKIYQAKVRDISIGGKGEVFCSGAVRAHLARIVEKNQGVLKDIQKIKVSSH